MANIDGTDNGETLDGTAGADTINGLGGNDTIDGLGGDDTLTGGAGADIFVFQAAGGNGFDTITDFDPDTDTFRIETGGLDFGPDNVWYVGPANGDLRVVMDTNGNGQRDDDDEYVTLTGILSGTGLESANLTVGGNIRSNNFSFGDDKIDFVSSTDPQPEPETPNGTADDETLNGTVGADTINGRDGNDILHGLEGNDILNGGEGDDTLDGGPGADMLDGGPGSDTASYQNSAVAVLVRLHNAAAVKFGDAEGDTLIDIEHVVGSEYNDTLAGDGEDNILEGRGGDDVLYGGPAGGDDRMSGGNGDDRIFGGKGNDTLIGGEGYDVLKGGPGEDVFIVDGDDMDVLYGGPDKDTFQFFPSDLGGGSISDFSDGEDVIDLTAFTGINSMDDLDIISHGDNARIELSGTDYLTTIILSDFDSNNLDNSDFLFGEMGDGTSPTTPTPEPETPPPDDDANPQTGTAGSDTIDGSGDNDTIDGLAGDDTLRGNEGSDRLAGGPGADILDGGDGDDELDGGDGDDELDGGDGDDELDGGRGRDTLRGGPGSDVFFYSSGQDTILDFTDGVDKINLSTYPLPFFNNTIYFATEQRGEDTVIWVDDNDAFLGLGSPDIILSDFDGNISEADFLL